MKTWHYNMVRIIKSPEFKESLITCLRSLEGEKDHSIVLSMLNSYFNLRNKNFSTNWLYLPGKKVTLHLNMKGIYFLPETSFNSENLELLCSLNKCLYDSIGFKDWVLTFKKTKPPKKQELECQLKKKRFI